MIAITIIFLFVLYTIACCMDGPDLKPRWKSWLGLKLRHHAYRLYPFRYCVIDKCKFYELATFNLPQYEKKYLEMLGEFARMSALNSRPSIVLQDSNAKSIESRVILSEGELAESRMYEDMARQHGIPEWQIPRHKNLSFMIEAAKQKCVSDILDKAKHFVSIRVDEDNCWPRIIINGKMVVLKQEHKEDEYDRY